MKSPNIEPPIHCFKCKKKTKNINVTKVQNEKGSWRLSATCAVCKARKSKFIKTEWKSQQEDDGKEGRATEAAELYKPAVKKFQKRRILTLGIDDMWAADLIVMSNYSDENDGFKYMLNVIDSFSKYAWSEPLKKKDGLTVAKAFERIVARARKVGHKSPNLLHCDKGLEFRNKDFRAVLNKHGIKMYHTESMEKSSLIERWNRTLNGKMKLRFYVNQNFRWIDILQELVREYNEDDVHRTIGMKPADVTTKDEETILKRLAPKEPLTFNDIKSDVKVGDRVRITQLKKTFGNKYQNNWTKEIFVIDKVVPTRPITYKLRALDGEEIVGSFYRKEIMKTIL